MACEYQIGHIIYCEAMHGLFAIFWCLPLLVCWWILTTHYTIWAMVIQEDFLCRILLKLGLSCLLVGLAFLSHVFADTYGLGF